MRKIVESESVLLLLACLFALAAVFVPGFATLANVRNILVQSGVLGALAVGAGLILLSGNLDLTPGSVVSLCSVVTALFMRFSTPAGILAGVLSCLAVATLSGLIVSKGRMPSLMVTLGMMGVARSAAMLISGGKSVTGVRAGFNALSGGLLAGIPVPFLAVLLGVAAMAFLLRRTRWGRGVYALGGNEQGAYYSGIRTDRLKFQVFLIASLFYALAGLIYTSRISSGTPEGGVGYELDAITAAVLGGIHLMGGRGRIRNVLAGTLILAVIANLMNLKGITAYSQMVIKGFIFIAIVGSRTFITRLASRKSVAHTG